MDGVLAVQYLLQFVSFTFRLEANIVFPSLGVWGFPRLN